MSNNSGSLMVNLRKFNIKSIPEDSTVIFIGRRRTGKSTLMKDLLSYHKEIPLGSVVSGTEESNGFFKKIIPSMFIHEEYNPMIVSNFVKRQRIIMKKIQKEENETGVKSKIDPRAFMILEDCLYDDSWIRDTNIRYLFMNGRHCKVFFMVAMQYPLGIPPILRTNVDFVFILKEPSPSNRRRIFDNFGACFPSFEFFCQVMDQCTQNFECLVIDNNSTTGKIEDTIFWYKADIQPDFRMCMPEFWKHSDEYFRDREEDNINNYDPTVNTKLKMPITVRKI